MWKVGFVAQRAPERVIKNTLHQNHPWIPRLCVEVIANVWDFGHPIRIERKRCAIFGHVNGNPVVLRSEKLRHEVRQESLES